MSRVQSSAIIDRWIAWAGLLLTVGLLVQSASMRPCSQSGVGGAESGETGRAVVASDAQRACGAIAPAGVVRAVLPEWSTPSMEGGESGGAVTDAMNAPVVEKRTRQIQRHLRVSFVLRMLRPVVLQI
jgi:hypothetical protein